ETERRRSIQKEYNEKYNITPTTINKKIHDVISATVETDETNEQQRTEVPKKMTKKEREKTIANIEKERSEERRVGKEELNTRSKRDWSSDVCSSDLRQNGVVPSKKNITRNITLRLLQLTRKYMT